MRAPSDDLRGEDPGNRCDEVASIHDGSDGAEARHRASHAALAAEALLDDAAQVAVVGDDDVLLRQIRALGGARAKAYEAGVEQTNEAGLHQRLASARRGKLVGHGDGEVDAPGCKRFADGAKLDGTADEPHARRRVPKKAKERGE